MQNNIYLVKESDDNSERRRNNNNSNGISEIEDRYKLVEVTCPSTIIKS